MNKEGITEEMKDDWEFYEWAYQLGKQLKEESRLTGPQSESHWLETFPEAKKVIPIKIKEWRDKVEKAQSTIKSYLKIINEKASEENKWFWLDVITYAFPEVEEIKVAKNRIIKFEWMIERKNNSKITMWKESLERARKTDIIRVVESYLKLRKRGSKYYALCPQHTERTSSFCLYPPNRYYCFSCNATGDQITFVQMMEKCSFKEAVNKLQIF